MDKRINEHLGQLFLLRFKYACCVFLVASIKIAVCEGSTLKGHVTIGSGTIVDPSARIIAEAGDIIIGQGNIIKARVVIANRFQSGESEPSSTPAMIIGNGNIFEVDSSIEALKMGSANVIGSNAFVGREVELTGGCIVGAGCCLTAPQIVAQGSIVCGSQCQRREINNEPYMVFRI